MTASSEHGVGARPVAYRETLRTPWWWYLIALFVAGIMAIEMQISSLHLTDWVVLCVLGPLFCFLVWSLGRRKIEIADAPGGPEIRVHGAHIPVRELSGAIALDADTVRRVVGREGDPAAFVAIRPWIRGGVQLWVDDPEDPTPYWLVSSRRPQRLVDAVRSYI